MPNRLDWLEHEGVDDIRRCGVRSQRHVQLGHESAFQVIWVVVDAVMFAAFLVIRRANDCLSVFLEFLLDPLIEQKSLLVVVKPLLAAIDEVVGMVRHGVLVLVLVVKFVIVTVAVFVAHVLLILCHLRLAQVTLVV